jgi:hypothetical protein
MEQASADQDLIAATAKLGSRLGLPEGAARGEEEEQEG